MNKDEQEIMGCAIETLMGTMDLVIALSEGDVVLSDRIIELRKRTWELRRHKVASALLATRSAEGLTEPMSRLLSGLDAFDSEAQVREFISSEQGMQLACAIWYLRRLPGGLDR